jgi:type II secretory pathway component GspD/PulD (secretin)
LRKLAFVLASLVALSCPVFAQEKKEEPKKEEPKKDDKKPEDPNAAIKKRLDGQKLTVNFDDTPLAEVMEFLHELTSVSFVFSKDARAKTADAKVKLKEKDALLKAILDKALGGQKLAYEVWKGVIFVSAKDEKKDVPSVKLEGDAKKKLEGKRLTLNFPDTPLSEVLQFLGDFSGVKFSAGEKVDAEKTSVAVKLKDCVAADALAIICRATGLKAVTKDGGVVLEKK